MFCTHCAFALVPMASFTRLQADAERIIHTVISPRRWAYLVIDSSSSAATTTDVSLLILNSRFCFSKRTETMLT